MCIWLPGWPLQRLSLERPELKQRTVLIYEDAARGQYRVVVCSKRALDQGVRPGMPKAEAEAFLQFMKQAGTPGQNAGVRNGPQNVMHQGCLSSSAQAEHEPHLELYDPATDRARLRDLAVWCRRFSPIVGVEDASPPECLLLNIEGVTHLFHNERAMARHVLEELNRVHIYARVAIADTVGMAWATAHYGTHRSERGLTSAVHSTSLRRTAGTTNSSKRNIPVIVPAGESLQALRSLPSRALRLPVDVSQTLKELDLGKVHQLLNLPKSTLPSRFGDVLHKRIDQALGEVPEPITPELPPKPTIERWQFEYVISDRRVIEMAIERLFTRTIATLEADRYGIQRVLIVLQGELGEVVDFTVGLIRPTISQPHLMRLVRTQLEQVRTPDDICEVRVELISSAPLDPRQETLFSCRDEVKARRERDQLFERIGSRLGEEVIVVAEQILDAQPERAFACEPITVNKGGGSRFRTRASGRHVVPERDRASGHFIAHRPLSVRNEPRQIDVLTVSTSGPPATVRWNGYTHPIAKSWGPERVHTGWWRDENIVRDYYRIETNEGLRLWVYHNVRNGDWFLHGVFD